MKKSTLLSLLTAGAVIATSAGTFAAWDQTQATTTGTVSLGERVTMEVGKMTFTGGTDRSTLSTTENDFSDLAQTASATVTVKNVPASAASKYELKYTYTVTPNGDGSASDVNVAINDANASTITAGSDTHTANITVTPTNVDAAGKSYSVQVEAELIAKTGE